MTALSNDSTKGIGIAVRDLRQQRKISVRSLAAIIDRSPAFVSQMERNISTPSLKDIYAIAAALNVPVSYFLQDVSDGVAEEQGLIIRKANRRIINDKGVTTAFLSPRPRDGIEFNQTVFQPLSSTQFTRFSRRGYETGLLISGRLDMTFAGSTFSLEAGDSYCFRLDEFHGSQNPSLTEDAVLVWSITDER